MKSRVLACSTFAALGIALLASIGASRIAKVKASQLTKVPPRGIAIANFPRDEKFLTDARDQGDKAAIKGHAWNLFQGLVQDRQDEKGPLWQDWCAVAPDAKSGQVDLICPPFEKKSQVKSLVSLSAEEQANTLHKRIIARMKLSLSIPRQILAAENAKDFAASTQQELETAEVLFDPKSAWQIIQCFSDNANSPASIPDSDLQRYTLTPGKLANVTTECRDASHTDYNSFGSLLNDSISVKTVWVVTAAAYRNISVPIPAWDWEYPEQQVTFANPWKSKVSIVLDGNTPCGDPSAWGVQDKSRLDPTVEVPLSCFYSIHLAPDDLSKDANIEREEIRKDTSSLGDPYLILLGFHVATREIPNWTWQTFWWSGRPGGPGDANHPFETQPPVMQKALGPQWSHFVMETTLGKPPGDTKSQPEIVYNPYLEGLLTVQGATQSNCAGCHQYSAFVTQRQNPSAHSIEGYKMGVVRSTEAPLNCSSADQTLTAYFTNAEKMDCLWSLSESSSANSQSLAATNLDSRILNLFTKIETDLKRERFKQLKK